MSDKKCLAVDECRLPTEIESMSLDSNSIPSKVIEQNTRNIASIDLDDLDFLESDLEIYEKVAVVFLLYGQRHSIVALQKLIGEFRSMNAKQTVNIRYLSEWARKEDKWREKIVEALCIAKANHAIIKLGLNLNDIKQRYLPQYPELNLFIHPVLKALYIVSESMNVAETKNLIGYINEKYAGGQAPDFLAAEFLEIHLLDWIQRGIVVLGEWSYERPNKNVKSFSELKPIVDYLEKNTELESLATILKNIMIRINFTKHNQIMIEKEKAAKKLKEIDEPPLSPTVKDTVPPPSGTCLASVDGDRYRIRKSNAGILLIINQHKFTKGRGAAQVCLTRDGTDLDKDALSKTFKAFGYVTIEENNVASGDIKTIIRNVVRASRDKDSLIVCILSHGTKGTFYASDSVPIQISSVVDEVAVKELNDIPKLIIVQACQDEEKRDEGYLERDRRGNVEHHFETFQLISSVPGFTSYRNPSKGSLFIQILCSIVQKNGARRSLSQTFNEVCAVFKQNRGAGDEKMCPKMECSATKDFYLPEG